MATKIYLPYGDEKPPKQKTHPGNRYEVEYSERYDENGHPYLIKKGEKDVYAVIQSHAEEYEIHALMARYANGDASVMRNDGSYIDASVIPSNYHEMFNLLNEQHEKFDALPIEIRQKFGMSFEQWAAQSGTDAWFDKMGFVKPQQKPEPETSKEESNGNKKQ